MTMNLNKNNGKEKIQNGLWKKVILPKIKAIVEEEPDFLKKNPHLKVLFSVLKSTILTVVYIIILSVLTAFLSFILRLLKVPFSEIVSIIISIIILITYSIIEIMKKRKN